MKLTKNHYHLKEMWVVLGKNGGIYALYNNKWGAEESGRYTIDKENRKIKRVQVLIGNEELLGKPQPLCNTSRLLRRGCNNCNKFTAGDFIVVEDDMETCANCGGSVLTKPKLTKAQEKRFEETRLAKEGGSSFECSDYEGIYMDMKQHLANELAKQKEEMLKGLGRIKLEIDVVICDCGEPYRDSDLADLVDQAIKKINE